MKRILIIAGIAGATLFSACEKDSDQVVAPAADPTTASKIIIPTGQATIAIPYGITYKIMMTQQDANLPVQWTSGNMTTSAILFNAFQVRGNALFKVSYSTNTSQSVNLFSPTVLGGIIIPSPGLDYDINFGVMLTNNNDNASNSFVLNGATTVNQEKIPVMFIVNQPLQLTGLIANNTFIDARQYYMASLLLNLDVLMNNINGNMLTQAAETNGTIIISANSNQNLYQTMFANLQNNMMQVDFVNENTAVVSPATALQQTQVN